MAAGGKKLEMVRGIDLSEYEVAYSEGAGLQVTRRGEPQRAL